MHRQTKAQGFWGWVVLGLCALAVAVGAFQASRSKPVQDPQVIETPQVIEGQSAEAQEQGDAEEVSVPVTIPVLPEEQEIPVTSTEPEPPAEPVIAAAPRIIVPPLEGETVAYRWVSEADWPVFLREERVIPAQLMRYGITVLDN